MKEKLIFFTFIVLLITIAVLFNMDHNYIEAQFVSRKMKPINMALRVGK